MTPLTLSPVSPTFFLLRRWKKTRNSSRTETMLEVSQGRRKKYFSCKSGGKFPSISTRDLPCKYQITRGRQIWGATGRWWGRWSCSREGRGGEVREGGGHCRTRPVTRTLHCNGEVGGDSPTHRVTGDDWKKLDHRVDLSIVNMLHYCKLSIYKGYIFSNLDRPSQSHIKPRRNFNFNFNLFLALYKNIIEFFNLHIRFCKNKKENLNRNL